MIEPKMSICTHDGPCVSCKENCWSAGDIEADCPKYYCDRSGGMDCERCEFLKQYLKEVYGYDA